MIYEDIVNVNATIQTMDIKGKAYAEVNQRIKAFRMLYPDGAIMTEILSNDNGVCVMKATVGFYNEDGDLVVLGTGTAYEKEGSTFINRTSYIEVCETSAVGRAIGMIGIGIDTSVASAEEVQNAMLNQKNDKAKEGVVAYSAKNVVKCPNCGNEVLREWSRKSNKWMEPEEVLEQCGGVCLTCYREAKK